MRSAVLIGVVLLAAASGIVYYEIVNPGCNSTPAQSMHRGIATDCKLGVTLALAISQTSLRVGANQTLYLSVANDFDRPNDVAITGFPTAAQFALAPGSKAIIDLLVRPNGCNLPIPPAFVLIYNTTSGRPLQMNTISPNLVSCQRAAAQAVAAVQGAPHFQFAAHQNLTTSFSVGGYFTSTNTNEPWLNATYHSFPTGRYSTVAFDGWKQMLKLNFTVSA